MRIGITGGTGFIGSHLIELLIEQGADIDCFSLPDQIPGWLSESDKLRFSIGDLLNPETLMDFTTKNDIIIHLAGATRAVNEAEFMNFNLQGTKNLIDAINLHNPEFKHLIIMSSQAAVGPSPEGVLISEDAAFNPVSPYGKSKALIEELLSEQYSELPVTIIRPPSVYGPRDRDFIELMRLIKRRINPIIGKKSKLSFVYVKNLVHGISLCIQNPKAVGEAFFITDDDCYSWAEFSCFVEERLGVRALKIYIPKLIIILASFISRGYSFITKQSVLLTKHKLKEMNCPYWTVSNAKAKKLLGYSPLHSTAEAVGETVNWYEAEGML